MQALLAQVIKGLIIDGIPKLVGAITDYFKQRSREKRREAAVKKYEETGDAQDLHDLESELNRK